MTNWNIFEIKISCCLAAGYDATLLKYNPTEKTTQQRGSEYENITRIEYTKAIVSRIRYNGAHWNRYYSCDSESTSNYNLKYVIST